MGGGSGTISTASLYSIYDEIDSCISHCKNLEIWTNIDDNNAQLEDIKDAVELFYRIRKYINCEKIDIKSITRRERHIRIIAGNLVDEESYEEIDKKLSEIITSLKYVLLNKEQPNKYYIRYLEGLNDMIMSIIEDF